MGDGCSGSPSSSTPNLQQRRAAVCTPGFVAQSNEVANICERYRRLSDPNRVSYVYLVSNTGGFFGEYQVKGKCSSTDSQVTNPQTTKTDDQGASGASITTLDAQQLDGSYGQNEQAIYCYIDDKEQTMIEFNTQFIWVDSPLPVVMPPNVPVVVPNGK